MKAEPYSDDSHLAVQARLRAKMRTKDQTINDLMRDLGRQAQMIRDLQAENTRLRVKITELRSRG